jgi:hypothetical protein
LPHGTTGKRIDRVVESSAFELEGKSSFDYAAARVLRLTALALRAAVQVSLRSAQDARRSAGNAKLA